jgi:uncharacterized protein
LEVSTNSPIGTRAPTVADTLLSTSALTSTGHKQKLVRSEIPKMQPSMFNLRVPLEARDEIFLMNTLTDAQLVVSRDVADLLDRAANQLFVGWTPSDEEREALALLTENGFLVENRDADRARLDRYLTEVKSDSAELNITLLTTLQCNFACDYCFQGDHGDYNLNADKMSMETAERVAVWFERELDRVRPERFVLTFFGGEPLLNLPVMYLLAERARRAADARGVTLFTNIITGSRRSDAAVRPQRREDHARRRQGHAQPDAAAARRPGHLRPHCRQHPRRRRPRPHRNRRQLRRVVGR